MKNCFFYLLALLFFGCVTNNAKEKKISPFSKNYQIANNNLFTNNQDTVLFGNKKFSGIKYLLYSNNDTAFSFAYFDGLEEGFSKKWYPNKQLAEERFFIKGKKEGIHKAWWQNGLPKFNFKVANDEYVGYFKEWNDKGILVKDFNYKNGQEEGSEKAYFDDGTIKANYIIANGRRYGLLGTKNCVNVSDSIFNK